MVIEGAIFINMGIPFLTGTKLPFIASIVIGTIQLGATVDYAILITSRYEKERGGGKSKKEAIQIAHKTSIPDRYDQFSVSADGKGRADQYVCSIIIPASNVLAV